MHPYRQRGAMFSTVLNGQFSHEYVQVLQIPISATFAAWNYSIKRRRGMEVKLSPRMVALRSGDAIKQLEVLRSLRDDDDDTLLNELLLMVTRESTDEQVRQEVVELLADVRSRTLVSAMGDALRTGGDSAYLPALVSICWMNRMDFSPILNELLALVSHSDLRVQVEAITSVELALEHCTVDQIRLGVANLKMRLKKLKGREARALVNEMINTLERDAAQRASGEKE